MFLLETRVDPCCFFAKHEQVTNPKAFSWAKLGAEQQGLPPCHRFRDQNPMPFGYDHFGGSTQEASVFKVMSRRLGQPSSSSSVEPFQGSSHGSPHIGAGGLDLELSRRYITARTRNREIGP